MRALCALWRERRGRGQPPSRPARSALAGGLSRAELASLLPAGAARNALDCALWDLEAKRVRPRAPRRLPGSAPSSLCSPPSPSRSPRPTRWPPERARRARRYPLLKLKLGGDGDTDRLAAVRAAVPQARLIVDANEAWQPNDVELLLAAAAAARVELVEQPLPAGGDDVLARIARPVPVCADESVHDRASLAALAESLRCGEYQARQDRRLDRGAAARGRGPRTRSRRSWSAAWSRPRWPWPLPCSLRKMPTGSISTVRFCSSATACRG